LSKRRCGLVERGGGEGGRGDKENATEQKKSGEKVRNSFVVGQGKKKRGFSEDMIGFQLTSAGKGEAEEYVRGRGNHRPHRGGSTQGPIWNTDKREQYAEWEGGGAN